MGSFEVFFFFFFGEGGGGGGGIEQRSRSNEYHKMKAIRKLGRSQYGSSAFMVCKKELAWGMAIIISIKKERVTQEDNFWGMSISCEIVCCSPIFARFFMMLTSS